jgi:hypothetical protein
MTRRFYLPVTTEMRRIENASKAVALFEGSSPFARVTQGSRTRPGLHIVALYEGSLLFSCAFRGDY